MKSLKEWIEHGLMHLTVSFLFALFGVDVVISAAATWLASYIHSWLGISTPPPHFYFVLGILIFCAVTLFAVLVLTLQKSVAAKAISSDQTASDKQSRLTIHLAYYGTGPDDERNVLPAILALQRDGLVIPVENNTLQCDPAPNSPRTKYLRIKYSYENDYIREIQLPEHSRMVIPQPLDNRGKP